MTTLTALEQALADLEALMVAHAAHDEWAVDAVRLSDHGDRLTIVFPDVAEQVLPFRLVASRFRFAARRRCDRALPCRRDMAAPTETVLTG
jgi:hypothetical protein